MSVIPKCKNLIGYTTGIFFTVVLASCYRETGTAVRYYNVDSLMTEQENYLSSAQASLRKIARLGEVSDTTFFQPKDSLAWKNELDVFRELEAINKPSYRGNYTVSDGTPDTKSNLTIRSFAATENLPVEFLKVYYYQSPNKLKKIEGHFSEKNSLYSSSRYFTLEFSDIGSKAVLTTYTIMGGQQMFLGDTVQYEITGTVVLPD